MQKADLIAKITRYREEMEPLALEWAKIGKRKWAARFEVEDFTVKDLTDRYKSLRAIHEGSFAALKKVWQMLPEAQWKTTFAQQMRHLPEYQDLRKALTEFKNQFLNKKKANAESQA